MTDPVDERGADGGDARAHTVIEALADATRRAVLRRVLADGPVTATEVADDLPVSRQAVAKHLGVLRGAGLVTASRAGRETRYVADAAPLTDTARWLTDTATAWDRRLARLHDRAATRDRG